LQEARPRFLEAELLAVFGLQEIEQREDVGVRIAIQDLAKDPFCPADDV
jgi:hypothetical protein